MSINLDKNKGALVQAWKEVMDERNPINWALFGYDGLTYDLNLVGKGDGGLDEMVEEFNSGKIQYALCRVKVKEKNLEKIVLINWQGEGAPLARKGMCANHIETIKSFFKGVHISFNARTDEDVEPDVILEMVGKSVAGEGVKILSQYNDVEPTPVGAVYKRVNPKEEINCKAKDDFWKKQEAEEEYRRKESLQRKFSQDEVKLLRKESQDYFDKEEQELAREKHESFLNKKLTPSPQPQQPQLPLSPPPPHVNGLSNGNRGHSFSSFSPTAHTVSGGGGMNSAERVAALHASTPTKNTNSDLVRQRIKSFDGGSSGPVFPTSGGSGTGSSTKFNNFNRSGSMSSSNSFNNSGTPTPTPTTNGGSGTNATATGDRLSVMKRKQLFEAGSISTGETNTVRRNPAEEIRQAQEEMKKQLKKENSNSSTLAVSNKIKAKEPEKVVSPIAHHQPDVVPTIVPQEPQQPAFFSNPSSLPKSPSPQPVHSPSPQPIRSPSPQPTKSPSPVHIVRSPSPQPLAKSPSPIPAKSPSPVPVVPAHQEQIQEDNSVRSAQAGYNYNGLEDQRVASSASPIQNGDGDTITINITPEMGSCARALYDYQAADETEITFDPGDIIRNIEKIDDGWWEGLGPNDQYGLFPANYVELLN